MLSLNTCEGTSGTRSQTATCPALGQNGQQELPEDLLLPGRAPGGHISVFPIINKNPTDTGSGEARLGTSPFGGADEAFTQARQKTRKKGFD